MNFLDKFRYSFDNLDEISVKPKVQKKLIVKNYENPRLKTLLSNSVKVSKEIFPKVQNAIEEVFTNLNLENRFNFFITANHFETQAYCSMMPESNYADNKNVIPREQLHFLVHYYSIDLSFLKSLQFQHYYFQASLNNRPEFQSD